MKKEDGRLRGMDGLRGVAIIAITLFHIGSLTPLFTIDLKHSA